MLRKTILNGDGDGIVVRRDVEAMLSENVYSSSAKSEKKYHMMRLFPP